MQTSSHAGRERHAKDRRSNNCRYVADAASIRVNVSFSVGYDRYCCAGPKDVRLPDHEFAFAVGSGLNDGPATGRNRWQFPRAAVVSAQQDIGHGIADELPGPRVELHGPPDAV